MAKTKEMYTQEAIRIVSNPEVAIKLVTILAIIFLVYGIVLPYNPVLASELETKITALERQSEGEYSLAVVNSTANIRSEASINGEIVGGAERGRVVFIRMEEMVEADGYEWYPVRNYDATEEGSEEGWIAGSLLDTVSLSLPESSINNLGNISISISQELKNKLSENDSQSRGLEIHINNLIEGITVTNDFFADAGYSFEGTQINLEYDTIGFCATAPPNQPITFDLAECGANLSVVVSHEIFHKAQQQEERYSQNSASEPWLREGTAEFLARLLNERHINPVHIDQRTMDQLSELGSFDPFEGVLNRYDIGPYAVDVLIRIVAENENVDLNEGDKSVYAFSKINEYYSLLGNEMTSEQAFGEVFGLSQQEFIDDLIIISENESSAFFAGEQATLSENNLFTFGSTFVVDSSFSPIGLRTLNNRGDYVNVISIGSLVTIGNTVEIQRGSQIIVALEVMEGSMDDNNEFSVDGYVDVNDLPRDFQPISP